MIFTPNSLIHTAFLCCSLDSSLKIPTETLILMPVSPCTIHLPTSKHIFCNAKDANTLYKGSHLKNH